MVKECGDKNRLVFIPMVDSVDGKSFLINERSTRRVKLAFFVRLFVVPTWLLFTVTQVYVHESGVTKFLLHVIQAIVLQVFLHDGTDGIT